MLYMLVLTSALLPAAILGWNICALAGRFGYDIRAPLNSQTGKMYGLILAPWAMLAIVWAALMAVLQELSAPDLIPATILLYLMLSLSLLATAMEIRRQLPKWVRTLRKRLDKLDERFHTRLP